MRKFYPLVLLALCACMPSAIKAQGQHASTHDWKLHINSGYFNQ